METLRFLRDAVWMILIGTVVANAGLVLLSGVSALFGR